MCVCDSHSRPNELCVSVRFFLPVHTSGWLKDIALGLERRAVARRRVEALANGSAKEIRKMLFRYIAI